MRALIIVAVACLTGCASQAAPAVAPSVPVVAAETAPVLVQSYASSFAAATRYAVEPVLSELGR